MRSKRIIRTAEVTIETEESIVLHAGADRSPGPMWCPVCRRYVDMVTPEVAAQIAGVGPRTVYRWIEAAAVHFAETNGSVLICLRSLAVSARDADAEISRER